MKKVKVVGGRLNVRTEPALTAEIVSVLEDGAELIVNDTETTDWYKTDTGYIKRQFTTPLEIAAEINTPVENTTQGADEDGEEE